MPRDLTHKSDWELLEMADRLSGGNGPQLEVLAELVRRGVAESSERREAIRMMGPALSQAERYITLAFSQLNEVTAETDDEIGVLARVQSGLAFQVRVLRAFGKARHARRCAVRW